MFETKQCILALELIQNRHGSIWIWYKRRGKDYMKLKNDCLIIIHEQIDW